MPHRIKFRAECYSDIELFFDLLPLGERLYTSLPPSGSIPDIEATIELKTLSLDDAKALMMQIPDGHVMLETVSYENAFTGIRNYTSSIQ